MRRSNKAAYIHSDGIPCDQVWLLKEINQVWCFPFHHDDCRTCWTMWYCIIKLFCQAAEVTRESFVELCGVYFDLFCHSFSHIFFSLWFRNICFENNYVGAMYAASLLMLSSSVEAPLTDQLTPAYSCRAVCGSVWCVAKHTAFLTYWKFYLYGVCV